MGLVMKKTNTLPIETVRELLDYDLETGVLTWKERSLDYFMTSHDCNWWNSRFAGKVVGQGVNGSGYLRVRHNGTCYYAHRMVWAHYYGSWPKKKIDHINGDREDNRISNLRDVTQRDNLRNQTMRKTNTSGFMGVHWNKALNKWRATIQIDRIKLHLGYFDDIEDAAKARAEAEVKYGFHSNHGKVMTDT